MIALVIIVKFNVINVFPGLMLVLFTLSYGINRVLYSYYEKKKLTLIHAYVSVFCYVIFAISILMLCSLHLLQLSKAFQHLLVVTLLNILIIFSLASTTIPLLRMLIKPLCSVNLIEIRRLHEWVTRYGKFWSFRNLLNLVIKFLVSLKHAYVVSSLIIITSEFLETFTMLLVFILVYFFSITLILSELLIYVNMLIGYMLLTMSVFLIFIEYKHITTIIFRSLLSKYSIDLDKLMKRIESGKKMNNEFSKIAYYRFREFIDNIKSANFKLAYINLITVLEALNLWGKVKKNFIGEYVRRKSSCNDINTYEISHFELRGALVHGAKKGINREIEEREVLIKLDPFCAITDLLLVLNSRFVHEA